MLCNCASALGLGVAFMLACRPALIVSTFTILQIPAMMLMMVEKLAFMLTCVLTHGHARLGKRALVHAHSNKPIDYCCSSATKPRQTQGLNFVCCSVSTVLRHFRQWLSGLFNSRGGWTPVPTEEISTGLGEPLVHDPSSSSAAPQQADDNQRPGDLCCNRIRVCHVVAVSCNRAKAM